MNTRPLAAFAPETSTISSVLPARSNPQSAQGPGSERRLHVPVEFTARESASKSPGIAREISLSNMFIETATPAAFGAHVLVGFAVPGGDGQVLLSGTVRWTSRDGMGVQFGLLGARETRAVVELERHLPRRTAGRSHRL